MFPSFVNLNHQLASAFVPAVEPWFVRLNILLALRFVDVITFQVSVFQSYVNPNSSNASILSIISVSNSVENAIVKFGITALTTAPFGTTLFNVTGPAPDSKFPIPPFAPSPDTAPIFAQDLSWLLSVVDVTNTPFKKVLVSGDVNLTNAPGLVYFKFEVAKSPNTKGPAALM